MKQKVQILAIDFMSEYEGMVRLSINKNEYSAFFFQDGFETGQTVKVEFDHLESRLEWDVIFNENKNKELKLEKVINSDWSYHGYGKITSIDPVLATFGDIDLELGTWTNDPNVIGEYIFWQIERLDVSIFKE